MFVVSSSAQLFLSIQLISRRGDLYKHTLITKPKKNNNEIKQTIKHNFCKSYGVVKMINVASESRLDWHKLNLTYSRATS